MILSRGTAAQGSIVSLSQRPNLGVSHHRHLIVALSHPRALVAVGNKTSSLVVEQVKWQQPLGQREIRDRIGHHLGVHLTWLWKTMGLFLYLGCLLRNMVGFDCDWRMLAMACFWRPRPPDAVVWQSPVETSEQTRIGSGIG